MNTFKPKCSISKSGFNLIIHYAILLEPGLLDELRRRVEVAEQNFKAAELDNRLEEFKAAKKLQVCCQKIKFLLNI